jgi:hypothetical protein
MEEDTRVEGEDVVEGWEGYINKGMCSSYSHLHNVLF